MRGISSGLTDVGLKRTHNEDNFSSDDDLGLYVVADGGEKWTFKLIEKTVIKVNGQADVPGPGSTLRGLAHERARDEKQERGCQDEAAHGGTSMGQSRTVSTSMRTRMTGWYSREPKKTFRAALSVRSRAAPMPTMR